MIQAFEQWAGKLIDCDDPDWWHERLGLWVIAWTESEDAIRGKLKEALSFCEPGLRAEIFTIIDNST